MFTRNQKILASVAATILLGVVSADSQAGRSVRSDAQDGAFESLGGFWGNDFTQNGPVPGFDAGLTEFKLKIKPTGDARFFRVCMGEGFIKLIDKDATCAVEDFARPPTGNYIAAFATDLEDAKGFLIRTRGFIDPVAPYKLWQTEPAMRFWWSGVFLAGDTTSPLDFQIVLIDRSNGSNNGNFDIEFNYGQGGGDVVAPISSDGFRGFVLGNNKSGPNLGPFGPFDTNGAPIRFCFRNGKRGCN